MRILLVHNHYQLYAGEDIAFEETQRALLEMSCDTSLLTAHNDSIPKSRAGQLLFAPYLLLSTFFNPIAFVRTLRRVHTFRPDVAIVQNVFPLLSPSVYLALKIARVPVYQRLFNYRMLCANGVLFTAGEICERCLGGSFTNAIKYRCYRNSRIQSAILATSLRIWKHSGLWAWGVHTYLPSTDFMVQKLKPYLPARHETRTVRYPTEQLIPKELGTDFERGRSVLFVGRIVAEKGIFTLVRAAALMQERDPTVSIRVVGTGDALGEAQSLADELGLSNVTWLGPAYGAAVWEELYSAGVFVLPSEWYDNMPIVLSQAMFAKAPVVASRINGIPEVIGHEENGLLFTPADPDEMFDAMLRLLDDPILARKLAERAFQTAQAEFGEDSFKKKLAAVLHERA